MNKSFIILDTIESPSDLRRLPESSLPKLALELRENLIHSLNICGGHFSANLGSIEVTIALHYVFNTPEDRIIWDTGHQAYPHKMLTGRRDVLHTIRQYGGLAPFPTLAESPFDAFGVGHCSTSISSAIGMAIANNLAGKQREVIAVIGDGGLTAGIAFEALNHLSECRANVLIILNDNQISISPTVGGLARYNVIFEKMGFHYIGPIDGHDLPTLIDSLRTLRKIKGPRLLHVMTQKGNGYPPAEEDPIKYHAVNTGFYQPLYQTRTTQIPQIASTQKSNLTYSQVFGDWLCDMAEQDSRLVALTPAMGEGSGLVSFAQKYPNRYFDVGISEQHCVTLAAGLAAEGYKPVVAIYSTFLQRAYDQLIHDVALQKLPVMFAIDRAGVVGFDGPTHGGFFDLSYLRCIPHIIVMTPGDENECRQMLTTGFLQSQPTAIRYPRGTGPQSLISKNLEEIPIGKASILQVGQNIALLAFGSMVTIALEVASKIDATVVNMRFIKPLDTNLIKSLLNTYDLFVTIEENVIKGGAGSAINEYLAELNSSQAVLNIGLPDLFIEHGSPKTLLAQYGLDVTGVLLAIEQKIKNLKNSSFFSRQANIV